MYDRLIGATLARPRTVALAWLCAWLACGLIATVEPGNIENNGFSVPGSETARAEALARRHIPSFAGTLIIAVLTSSRPSTTGQQLSDIQATLEPVASLRDVGGVESVAASPYEESRTGRRSTLLVAFIHMKLPYAAAQRHIPEIEATLQRAAGGYVAFGLLGEAAAAYHYSTIIRHDLTRAELIALPITFCMLVVAFLSVIAALLPILLAVATLTCTLAVVHLISLAFGVSIFIVDTASAVALGLSVDYSLIVITRFREERETACSVRQAIERAMQTAGRAVVLSGLTIAALLPALLLVGVGLFTSIALGGIIASLAAVLAATTLLPATLALLDKRLDRFSFRPAVEAYRRATFWRRLARAVTTHPLVAMLASLTVLLALSTPAVSLELDFGTSAVLPSHTAAARAEGNLAAAFGPGATGLMEVVTNEPQHVSSIVEHDPNTFKIWRENDGSEHWSEIDVLLKTGPNSSASRETVTRLRHQFDRARPAAALVGGLTAGEMDLSSRVAARMPAVVAVAIAIALLALVIGLRSIVIPLKAMACSALSVAATLGLLQACFAQSGESPGIVFFVPVVTFTLVLGLSIDYEVFLLSRVRELADSGCTTASAVSCSLTRTARPITLAGLVVATVFAAFGFSSLKAVQQLGVAVTIGVVLDVSLVRWLLSPACVVLAGRLNWWFPHVRRLTASRR